MSDRMEGEDRDVWRGEAGEERVDSREDCFIKRAVPGFLDGNSLDQNFVEKYPETQGCGSLSKDLIVDGWVKVSLIDFPGSICSTLFFSGCNLRCRYCHNPQMALGQGPFEEVKWDTVEEFLKDGKGILDGVCFSGGEPTLRPNLYSMAFGVKRLGFKVKVDTNGTMPENLFPLIRDGLLDYAAVDVKGPPGKYREICGVDVDESAVMETVETLEGFGIPFELRTTVHQDVVSWADMLEMARWMQGERTLYIQPCRTTITLDPRLQGTLGPNKVWLEGVAEACAPYFSKVIIRG